MNSLGLTDDQAKELNRLLRFYHKEVERCRNAKAYFAGCVMAAAELETALILMVDIYSEEAKATEQLPNRKREVKPLLEWNFAELLRVAKAAGWLPSALEYGTDDWNARKALVGDYAEVVREFRNLVHPARYMEDHYKKRVTIKHLEAIVTSVDAANSWLIAKIEKSLIEAMNSGTEDSEKK